MMRRYMHSSRGSYQLFVPLSLAFQDVAYMGLTTYIMFHEEANTCGIGGYFHVLTSVDTFTSVISHSRQKQSKLIPQRRTKKYSQIQPEQCINACKSFLKIYIYEAYNLRITVRC